ncbi:ATP-binding cassette domain-containing protein [Hathewaya histolytica]|uniref:ABC transporter ATP-binding protein n=1 Tax=Hathewaya histolytica TaxID=1498 RepID=A0A4U9QTY7_HATHI|nr:ATP-binding cassette domain-containing protein [Hathewaya histolytica]VTQ82015.1 ABC transporter ATP-binding protein [Hathewaya histolytica]
MIKLENISKKFKDRILFKSINLEIKEGETVGFVGGNGSGKSVLFSIIAGTITPDEGSVIVNNKIIGRDVDFPENTGVFINSPGFVDIYTGFQNLYYLSMIQNKIDKDKIRKTMRDLNLNPDDKTRVKKYSLGMRQKLGIAQAIMEDQTILILDEPFNALDFKTHSDIINIINKCQEEGKTILITSHNHHDIETLCDKIYFIEDQKVIPFTDELKNRYFNHGNK